MRSRQDKFIAILALCVAVVGLTLGFAAFSSSLIISSSAVVKPNEFDFVMKVYGISQALDSETVSSVVSNVSSYDSLYTTMPLALNGAVGNSLATIDNENLVISDLTAGFTEPNQVVNYYFVVKNEGEYAAYINFSDFKQYYNDTFGKTCVALSDASVDLVTKACEGIEFEIVFASSGQKILFNGTNFSENYKIEKNDYIYFYVILRYKNDSTRADGDFSVKFDDLKFDFSTTIN